jgi:hypothetical protein
MHPDDEKILKLAKEVIIKFIELGRISPTNFEEHFRGIFWAMKNTVVDARFIDLDQSRASAGEPEE